MNCEDSAIPASWAWVDIGSLGLFLGGGTPAKNVKEYWDSADIPWVSPKDMKQDDIHSAEMSVSQKALDKTSLSRVTKGSLIMVTRSGILSRTFPVAINHCDVVINQDLKALIPFSGVNAKFLMLMCQYFTHQILADCSKQGTTVASINTSSLQGFKVPLAPTPEQLRIVAKIEALFSEIDHGVEELKAAQQKLKRARQALLKAAFEGKLTARWRAENPDKLESPEALRQRIQAEREAYQRRQLEEWEKAVEEWRASGSEGRKPRKPRFSEPLLLSKEEIHDLPELPKGWLWERYGNLCSLVRNGISKKPSSGQGLKVFRISAVRPMRLDLSDYRYFDDVEQYEDYVLTSGDLLFTRYNGSRHYVGVSAVFRSDDRYVFPDKLVQTRLLPGDMSPEYYQYATNSGGSRRFIESMIRTTAGQSGVSGADIKSMPVPVCSKNEQVKIVEALESRLSEIEQLEGVLQASLQRAESLKQSILKQAFSGRLVPQDPDDEPASELLARIRAEREAEQAAAPRRRRGKKAEATP